MRLLRYFFLGLSVSTVLLASCDEQPKHPDTLARGTIEISADESFKPIIEEQLRVFDSSYPEAHITVHYKPEAECFKDYFDNKARIILVTRELTKEEKEVCAQKKIITSSEALAGDGIAVVVNKESQDTVLDINGLKGILTGVYKKKYTVVFDNQSSGTVRYITDSVLKGEKLGSNVFAAKGSREVIDYVANNPDAIGFVGMSYVYRDEDTSESGTFVDNVKVVAMQNEKDHEFYKPYQAYLALKSYPLTRKLYYINAESYHGLGTGFANFLGSYRGQLIFLHAHFFPLKQQIVIREAKINNQ